MNRQSISERMHTHPVATSPTKKSFPPSVNIVYRLSREGEATEPLPLLNSHAPVRGMGSASVMRLTYT